MSKVVGTYTAKKAAHDPDLVYQVQDPDGTIQTFYNEHENGPRRQRRYKQRHHPFFTKTRTGGRNWQIEWEEKDANARAKNA